jgi:hypothetical protein
MAGVLLSVSSAISGRQGGEDNVQRLLNFCKAEEGDFRKVLCAGYISGVGDLMHINGVVFRRARDASVTLDDRMCAAPSRGAQVQAFVNWAEAHPQTWQSPSIFGVVTALSEAWPCLSSAK